MIHTITNPRTGKEVKYVGIPQVGCTGCMFNEGALDHLCSVAVGCADSPGQDSLIFVRATRDNIARAVAHRLEGQI